MRAHYKTKSVPDMAKALKRANTTIYKFMDALGLKPLGRDYTTSQDHPFRVSNRKLEKMLLKNRIENHSRPQVGN